MQINHLEKKDARISRAETYRLTMEIKIYVRFTKDETPENNTKIIKINF